MRPGKTTTASIDIERARDVAVRAAEAAGAILGKAATQHLDVRTKGTGGDVVTALDLAAEQLIIEHIHNAYPGHRIIAEESGLHEAGNSSWSWLVDPLDGTNNIVIGLSAFVVGIALCQDEVPVLGVVHDPVAGQTWSAVRGRGTCGPKGTTLCPPYRPAASGPVLAWTQGHSVARTDETARAMRMVLESGARRVLQLWAPLLSWVMLARGDIDGFVGYRPEVLDLPAGKLIAQEAGITVCRLDGAPVDEHIDLPEQERSFVAGPPDAIPDLLALLSAAQRVTIMESPGEQQSPDAHSQRHDGEAKAGQYELAQGDPKTMITTGVQAQQGR
jgi:myo-inositol-1(or 4)-monophosphatase